MAYSIIPGEELQHSAAEEEEKVDDIAFDLLDELVARKPFLEESRAFLEGDPLGNEYEPDEDQQFNGMEQLRDMSRNNYAKLIVDATTDRLGILGFRTSGGSSEFGDDEAMRLFVRDGMDSRAQEAMGLACGYRTSYLAVDPLSKRQQVIPPTNASVINDISGEPIAAISVHRDRALGRQVLRVYTRGVNEMTGQAEGPVQMFVATKEDKRLRYDNGLALKLTRYDSEVELNGNVRQGWVWWKQQNIDLTRIPITPLTNRDGRNEFELHQSVINRLNHMIYQRVIIATMQAFRQRAVKGNFPETDPKTGRKIDYEDMFEAGPARLWLLPQDADLWESNPPQFQDILNSVKEDRQDLASGTYTPISYFSDSVNNSAEGANLQRENYMSKIGDRRRRFGSGWKRHISIAFEANGMEDRASEDMIEVIWAPANILSLNERTQAFATMRQNGVSYKTALREGLGMTPTEAKRAIQEQSQEILSNTLTQAVQQATPLSKVQKVEGANTQPQTEGDNQ